VKNNCCVKPMSQYAASDLVQCSEFYIVSMWKRGNAIARDM
jgi:hypothetical protein